MDDNEAVIEKMSTEKVVKSLWELVRLCKYQERPFRYQLSLKRAIRAIENTEGNDPEKITKECPACGVPTGTSHKSICSAGHGIFGFKNAPEHGCIHVAECKHIAPICTACVEFEERTGE